MGSRRRTKTRAEAHVRLYRHELECDAYRSLSTDARALLVEFRALYSGDDNAVYMSLREAMRRLNVGRWRAEKAINELLDRGFVRVIEPGGFSRKTRHATVYALTNEAVREGVPPTKDFMKWRAEKKSTVLVTSTDGASHQHSAVQKITTNGAHGVSHQHRQAKITRLHGASHQHTDKLPARRAIVTAFPGSSGGQS